MVHGIQSRVQSLNWEAIQQELDTITSGERFSLGVIFHDAQIEELYR